MSTDGKRPFVDWERVETDFRAGQLSVREIARQHGISDANVRKRAKASGWTRDLTGAVREAIRAKLTKADGAGAHGAQSGAHPLRMRTDSEIVDDASDRGVAVIEMHRADIAQLDRVKRILLNRLEAHLEGHDHEGPCLGERETPGDLLEKISRVTQRSIVLGRQAHNLDDVKSGGETLGDLIAASMPPAERARLAGKPSHARLRRGPRPPARR